MKAKFTVEIEATKEEIDSFTKNINKFVYRNNDFLMDVHPVGGYVPRFYLPTRKRRMNFKKEINNANNTKNTWKSKKVS